MGRINTRDVGYLTEKSELCVAEVLNFEFLPNCLTSLLGESHVWTSKNSVVVSINPAMWDIYRKSQRFV